MLRIGIIKRRSPQMLSVSREGFVGLNVDLCHFMSSLYTVQRGEFPSARLQTPKSSHFQGNSYAEPNWTLTWGERLSSFVFDRFESNWSAISQGWSFVLLVQIYIFFNYILWCLISLASKQLEQELEACIPLNGWRRGVTFLWDGWGGVCRRSQSNACTVVCTAGPG